MLPLHRRNHNLRVGLPLTVFLTALALLGAVWTPYGPNTQNAADRLRPPSLAHLLGTDNFGRDIFSRVLAGAGNTLFIAAAVVLIGAAAGAVVGALTGYFGGWLDEALMRLGDTILAFPSLLLALVLISLLGPGKYNIILSLGILFIPSFARITRGEFARCKNLDYVQSARLMGASHQRVMLAHILPNMGYTLLSAVVIGFNNAVLAEASMSYLGLGVQPPEASLGRMLSESQAYLFSAPWYALSAGSMTVLLILGFSMLGEGIGQLTVDS